MSEIECLLIKYSWLLLKMLVDVR